MPGARITSGKRVTLRTLETEDIQFIQRSVEPEIRYPLGNPVRNREEFELSEGKGTDQLLVCLDDDDTSSGPLEGDSVTRIGQVGVNDTDYKRPELGYWLVPEVHGEGYGKEAVALVVEFVFRSYDTPAIGADAFASNEASRGLLESLGFTEEGRRRKYMFVDGAHRDMVQYGLLREEWREQRDS